MENPFLHRALQTFPGWLLAVTVLVLCSAKGASAQDNASTSQSVEVVNLDELPKLNQLPPDSELLQSIQVVKLSRGKTREAEGFLRFQVSTFSPLLFVRVNGINQMISPNSDFALYEVPYQLREGENRFLVEVQTRVAYSSELLKVEYTPPPIISQKTSPPFSLMVMLSEIFTDNVLLAPPEGNIQSASVNELVLSPGYRYDLSPGHQFKLEGLLKVDRQRDRSLASRETAFRQAQLSYTGRDYWGVNLKISLGSNTISQKKYNPYLQSEELDTGSSTSFLGVNLDGQLLSDLKLDLGVKADQQTSNDSPASNSESNEVSLKFSTGLFFATQTSFSSTQKTTAFVDPQKNNTSSTLSLDLKKTLGQWIFGGGLSVASQNYQQPQAGSSLVWSHQTSTLSLNSGYQVTKQLITDLSLKRAEKNSNDESQKYLENRFELKLIYSL